jgi:glucokinase
MITVRAAAMTVSSLVMGAVVGLGAAATLLERAGTVSFDGDGGGTVAPTRRSSHPFEDRAA